MSGQLSNVVRSIVPRYRLASMNGETSPGDALALPIDPRVLECARQKISHDIGEAVFRAQPLIKRQLLGGLGRLVGRVVGRAVSCGTGCHGFFDALFTSAFSAPGELFVGGHSLTGALVGFTAAGSEKVAVLFLRGAAAATSHHGRDG